MNEREQLAPASHLKAVAALAIKHDMTLQFWRELQTYRTDNTRQAGRLL